LDNQTVIKKDDTYKHTLYTNSDDYHFEFIHFTYEAAFANGHCFPGGDDDGNPPQGGLLLSCPWPDPKEASFIWGELVLDYFIRMEAAAGLR